MSTSPDSFLGRVGTLLARRPSRNMLAAALVSRFGDALDTFAFQMLVLRMTGSAAQMGLLLMVNALPNLLFAVAGGSVADKLPLRKIVPFCEGARSVIVAVCALLVFLGLCPVWLLFVFTFLNSTMETLGAPAMNKMPPILLEPGELNGYLGMTQTLTNLATIVGFAVAGLLMALIGAHGMLLLDALTFLYSAVLLRNACQGVPEGAQAGEEESASTVSYMLEGVRFLRKHRLLLVLCLYTGWINLMLAPINVLGILYARDILPGGEEMVGFLYMGFLGGLMLGGLVVTWLNGRLHGRYQLAIGVALVGLGFASLIVPPLLAPSMRLAATVAGCLLTGLGAPLASTAIQGVLLQQVPGHVLGRVMALSLLLAYAATPLGSAVSGLLGDAVAIPQLFAACGLIIFCFALPPLVHRLFQGMRTSAPASEEAPEQH